MEGKSAIDLGQEIKTRFKTWRNMTDVEIAEWKQIKGLGITKISQLLAAIEIGQRIQSEIYWPEMLTLNISIDNF